LPQEYQYLLWVVGVFAMLAYRSKCDALLAAFILALMIINNEITNGWTEAAAAIGVGFIFWPTLEWFQSIDEKKKRAS
jgi:hypothetical protein